MLSFEEKLAIADSFHELQRKDVSLGRVNYHYEQSTYDKKTVIYHLHPNGNGYVYAADVIGYSPDAKGFVNIRDFSADKLRSLIGKSIRSLSKTEAAAPSGTGRQREERWTNAKKQSLVLKYEAEDGNWYLYSGAALDSVFETYEEARQYLEEEGFSHESGQ